ncbi:hypothetical protein SAMN02799631_02256 [Methylobacterium sp. 174MFSha1.1]|uniref:DUF6883 domain-containing protein n=1 Tax=Methylobacterium sp. 174MFSha1.1 TaxID=1502749 RepID=UPI0008DFB18F|nr:DUF6883 domain-containing protein [Methylobacterium sp. 174MFSha1.1]SFU78317.1 hypothetical protein SAMN02799631_02256 [Methylobacterium sp. 174MFSha1.1]
MTTAYSYPSAFTIPEAKVVGYLLNLNSDDGAANAALLVRFGFSPDRPLDLMDALGRHPSPTRWTAAFEAPHGIKHYFEGPLLSPDGRNPHIRSVWQIDNDGDGGTAKFITIRPVTRQAERSV